MFTKQYDMKFKAEYDAFMKQKQFYKANTTKAYALLWEQCLKRNKVPNILILKIPVQTKTNVGVNIILKYQVQRQFKTAVIIM
jgi:hypothetical protein